MNFQHHVCRHMTSSKTYLWYTLSRAKKSWMFLILNTFLFFKETLLWQYSNVMLTALSPGLPKKWNWIIEMLPINNWLLWSPRIERVHQQSNIFKLQNLTASVSQPKGIELHKETFFKSKYSNCEIEQNHAVLIVSQIYWYHLNR